MGNCGVGFAPVRPGQEDWLIQLMEGVEDIPGTALNEGITWGWETFPEYLDALDTMPRVMDVGTQVPHGAVRAYVMGERGARNEPATPDDIEAMADLVREGIQAGALGFSTSRTIMHKAVDGEPVPGTFAAEDELFGIGKVLGELGTGLFELAPAGVMGEDLSAPEKEVAWMRRLSATIGRPVSFALSQHNLAPDQWRDVLRLAQEANAEGADLRGQVGGRPLNLLIGFQTFHPFVARPTYAKLAHLPLAERVAELRKPEIREAILSETSPPTPLDAVIGTDLRVLFPIGEPPDYEPSPDKSIAAIAAREGRDPEAVLYDVMLGHDGRELVMKALLGYSYGNLDDMREMILHPNAVLGLSDGGARLRRHLRRVDPDVHAHALDPRPRPRRPTPDRAGRAEADPRHRRGLRPRRPRGRGPRLPRRPQRDRLRRAVARPPGARARPPRWRPSAHPTRRRLPPHVRRRRGDDARRRRDRRPPGQARARDAMSSTDESTEGRRTSRPEATSSCRRRPAAAAWKR